MLDQDIIELFFKRDEAAIARTKEKYGRYLFTVAANIVEVKEDAEECVNDTYLDAWNLMPPKRPDYLKLFLAKLTRNRAFHIFRDKRAQKRGGGELPAVLEELEECLSGGAEPEAVLDEKELAEFIGAFLEKAGDIERGMFLCRYFYAEPVKTIAKRFAVSENYVSVNLHRMREKLKDYLALEGVYV